MPMTSTTNPRVSVVIPCYNLGAFLDEAVDSVLSQTYQDFEIIIVNDGSTDPETNRLLSDYRRPRTRVIQIENRGLAAARNCAIQHATGTYVSALDADDRYERTFLEKTTRILDEDADVTFVSCWLQNFGEQDWVWKQDRCDFPVLLGECTVATPALVRKSALDAVGGYDERMPHQGYEDWDLWITLVEQGYRGTIVPEVLFYYRRRAGSMSDSCCTGQPHLELMRYLTTKHEASYRQHLLPVLLRREAESCELLRQTYALDREIDGWLVPVIARRRDELARLQKKLAKAQEQQQAAGQVSVLQAEAAQQAQRAQDLARELANVELEVAALRQSISWRLTSPLRTTLDVWRALTAGARAAK
jgi:GT2 family glycosyltransferase